MRITSTARYLFLIFLISFFLYFPSLFNFYTNDDFFHLSIANAGSVKEFINFFNLTKAPEGWGLYRPLTTQVYYFITIKFFNLNPMPLHVISFVVFFINIFLVYKLVWELTKNRSTSLLSGFFYGTSATHFGHLYFLGAFQELGMALFFLISVFSFIKFLNKSYRKYLVISIVSFVLSLLSKETAAVLPFLLLVIYWYIKTINKTTLSFRKMLVSLAPYFSFLLVYFYFRIAHYGFAQGESYIWDFSLRRAINTVGWYSLWSFNLPEMLVDFVEPGFHFNPNLFKFWSSEISPIFILFGLQLVLLFYAFLKSNILSLKQKKLTINHYSLSIIALCAVWFAVTLLPVLFLPLHKFTFYLTLPLVGVVIFISYLFVNSGLKRWILFGFLGIWFILSLLTLNLTSKTNWIVSGAKTAKSVHNYLTQNIGSLRGIKTFAFYDTEEDETLPWSPTEILRVVLSDQNYFKVFWKGEITASYSGLDSDAKGVVSLKSRQFLGY